jgi:hypothetical protein
VAAWSHIFFSGRASKKFNLAPKSHSVMPGCGIQQYRFWRLEVLSATDIFRADAVLTHSDPRAYGGKFLPRDAVTLGLKKPTIFIQH